MGPPGGYNEEYHGYTIYNDKLWMAIDSGTNTDFFSNATGNIDAANQRWIGWYGSLTDGVLNYACITTNDENGQYYCYEVGQPYAPALNYKDEIHPIMEYKDIPKFILNKRAG